MKFLSRVTGGNISIDLLHILLQLDASEEDRFEMEFKLVSTDFVEVTMSKKEKV